MSEMPSWVNPAVLSIRRELTVARIASPNVVEEATLLIDMGTFAERIMTSWTIGHGAWNLQSNAARGGCPHRQGREATHR